MSIFASIKDAVAKYAEVYIKLLKVNAIGKTSSLMAYVMFALICMMLMFCTMLLLGFGLVEVFCVLGLSRVMAFVATFGVYLLMLFSALAMRKGITRAFAGAFVRILTEGDNENNED